MNDEAEKDEELDLRANSTGFCWHIIPLHNVHAVPYIHANYHCVHAYSVTDCRLEHSCLP